MNYKETIDLLNTPEFQKYLVDASVDNFAVKIETSIGVNPGYKNIKETKDTKLFYEVVSTVIDATNDVTNIPVSFIINESRALYSKDFGCPADGEIVYTLSTVMNPAFPVDKTAFIDAVLYAFSLIANFYKQETICVIITDKDGIHTIRYKYNYSNKENKDAKE